MLAPNFTGKALECGVDEAGRGSLCGPVVAAAVILPPDYNNPDLNDSKKLTAAQREALRQTILQDAVAWNLGMASVAQIDRYNIFQAAQLAMTEAVEGLAVLPEFLAVDGKYYHFSQPFACLVGGDARFQNIAAAGILAKTFRDDLMLFLHAQNPEYEWSRNKGYATARHRALVRQHGLSVWHRSSFNCMGEDPVSFKNKRAEQKEAFTF